MAKTSKLRKKYEAFMMGKDAKSLEETLVTRLSQVDKLISANEANEKNIRKMFDNMKFTFQKVGLVKYDAFNEMGGKLSFSLAMLNESDNGFVLNAVHSREGCYTYIKEIIDGNSIITLAEEEQEALKMAKESVPAYLQCKCLSGRVSVCNCDLMSRDHVMFHIIRR